MTVDLNWLFQQITGISQIIRFKELPKMLEQSKLPFNFNTQF